MQHDLSWFIISSAHEQQNQQYVYLVSQALVKCCIASSVILKVQNKPSGGSEAGVVNSGLNSGPRVNSGLGSGPGIITGLGSGAGADTGLGSGAGANNGLGSGAGADNGLWSRNRAIENHLFFLTRS